MTLPYKEGTPEYNRRRDRFVELIWEIYDSRSASGERKGGVLTGRMEGEAGRLEERRE